MISHSVSVNCCWSSLFFCCSWRSVFRCWISLSFCCTFSSIWVSFFLSSSDLSIDSWFLTHFSDFCEEELACEMRDKNVIYCELILTVVLDCVFSSSHCCLNSDWVLKEVSCVWEEVQRERVFWRMLFFSSSASSSSLRSCHILFHWRSVYILDLI